MLNRYFGKNTHTYLHLFGLSGIAVGIPLNKIVMSIGMMFVVLNLLLEGDFKNYYQNLKSNKVYLFILGFFLLHLVSILWSSNLQYALNDLRVKLPLLVLPTVIVAKPINKEFHLRIILWSIIISTLVLSLINFLTYNQFFGERVYTDIRGMSLFISHIRFAVIISMVTLILITFISKKNTKLYNLFLLTLILWFCYYNIYSQVLSGILTLFVGCSLFIFIQLWKTSKKLLIPIFSVFLIFIAWFFLWLFSPVKIDTNIYQNLPKKTINGNEYTHNFAFISPKNNQPTHLYIANKELDSNWKMYSKIPIDSLDKKGQPIKETLIRYLFSKNLHKDSLGLTQLSPNDIQQIELGETSDDKNTFFNRFYSIKYELINNYDPNGHSLLQRMEFWKTGWQIAKKNLLFGTGSGDVQDEFNKQYIINDSKLKVENRKRAHNYYLTILITFGIIGLIYFLWVIVHFLQFNTKNNTIIGLLFMAVILASFLVEDTLETQTGVTFFGLFYGLYSFKKIEKE